VTFIQVLISNLGLDADYSSDERQKLEELFQEYYQPLYYFILKMVFHEEDALEILQESFVRLLSTAKVFDSKEHRKNYLFRIAGNLCISRKRGFDRGNHLSVDEMEEVGISVADKEADISTKYEYAEMEERLMMIIEKRPPAKRQVLLLKKIDGMSYNDVAEITGFSVRHLKRIIKSELEEIITELKEAGFVEAEGFLS